MSQNPPNLVDSTCSQSSQKQKMKIVTQHWTKTWRIHTTCYAGNL